MFKYNIRILEEAEIDLVNIKKYIYSNEKQIKKIYVDIQSLEFMPKRYKTLSYAKDKTGEYRRMISGNYSIIYKILEEEIIIIRIFHQKQNFLNQSKFILKENSNIYKIK